MYIFNCSRCGKEQNIEISLNLPDNPPALRYVTDIMNRLHNPPKGGNVTDIMNRLHNPPKG